MNIAPQQPQLTMRRPGPVACMTSSHRPGAAASHCFAAAFRMLTERACALSFPLCVCSVGLFCLPLSAQSIGGGRFSLNGGPVTQVGGTSGGGAFAMEGGLAQTSTPPLTGGTFAVTGSLIGVAVVSGEVTLDFTTDEDRLTLSWPAEAIGYVLESTSALGDVTNWQSVTPAPVGNTYSTPLNHPLRFFRLRRQ